MPLDPQDYPLVSVVMPARNAEATLPATLTSLENQSHRNWELLVTNDGSTDATRETVANWASTTDRAVHIEEAEGIGPSAARNLAAFKARGRFLAFLDADDVWHQDKLAQQLQLFHDQTTAIAVTCDYAIVDGSSGRQLKQINFDWSEKACTKWILMEGVGPALCSTLLVRTEKFREVGGFDDEMWNLEDVDLALRLGAPENFAHVSRVLCNYILQPRQNHKEMGTVRASVASLQRKPPFSSHQDLSDRLQTNLELLETVRRFRRTRSPRNLVSLLPLWAKAPLTVTRTIFRTAAR